MAKSGTYNPTSAKKTTTTSKPKTPSLPKAGASVHQVSNYVAPKTPTASKTSTTTSKPVTTNSTATGRLSGAAYLPSSKPSTPTQKPTIMSTTHKTPSGRSSSSSKSGISLSAPTASYLPGGGRASGGASQIPASNPLSSIVKGVSDAYKGISRTVTNLGSGNSAPQFGQNFSFGDNNPLFDKYGLTGTYTPSVGNNPYSNDFINPSVGQAPIKPGGQQSTMFKPQPYNLVDTSAISNALTQQGQTTPINQQGLTAPTSTGGGGGGNSSSYTTPNTLGTNTGGGRIDLGSNGQTSEYNDLYYQGSEVEAWARGAEQWMNDNPDATPESILQYAQTNQLTTDEYDGMLRMSPYYNSTLAPVDLEAAAVATDEVFGGFQGLIDGVNSYSDDQLAALGASMTSMMNNLSQLEGTLTSQIQGQMGADDPTMVSALGLIRQEATKLMDGLLEEMNARGVVQSGLYQQALQDMNDGVLNEQQKFITTRVSELQNQLNNVLINMTNARAGLMGQSLTAEAAIRQTAMANLSSIGTAALQSQSAERIARERNATDVMTTGMTNATTRYGYDTSADTARANALLDYGSSVGNNRRTISSTEKEGAADRANRLQTARISASASNQPNPLSPVDNQRLTQAQMAAVEPYKEQVASGAMTAQQAITNINSRPDITLPAVKQWAASQVSAAEQSRKASAPVKKASTPRTPSVGRYDYYSRLNASRTSR